MNQKFRNIVVCGDVGTGTTTLSKRLAKALKWKQISIGDFFREWAKKNDIPLWNKEAVPDDLDKKIDYKIAEILKTKSKLIVDGHYTGWISRDMADIFRILLICNKEIATQRILQRDHTHKEKESEIEERRKQLRTKFKKLYSENDSYDDPKFFHLVIDTAKNDEQQTFEIALNAFQKLTFQK